MLSVGLIGGIASGKSEVARLLAERGAVVVDADRVAHEAYAPGTSGHASIVAAFGEELIGTDGAIDRRKLGAVVFNNPPRMRQLTDIVWPLTRGLLVQRKHGQEALGTQVWVLEAAVMVEAGWDDLVGAIWLVRTPVAVARQRLMERRGLSAADADARIAARDLAPLEQAATLIIENDGDIAQLESRVEAAWQALSAK